MLEGVNPGDLPWDPVSPLHRLGTVNQSALCEVMVSGSEENLILSHPLP